MWCYKKKKILFDFFKDATKTLHQLLNINQQGKQPQQQQQQPQQPQIQQQQQPQHYQVLQNVRATTNPQHVQLLQRGPPPPQQPVFNPNLQNGNIM